MTRRALVAMAITLSVLVVGSFYLRALARRIFERPQHREEALRTQLNEAALQSGTSSNETVTLYFPSYIDGKLIAETRAMAWATSDTDRIRQVVLALIEGSRPGQDRTLPPSTRIRAVFLTSDGTAYIDFSNEGLGDLSSGIEAESLVTYSIVASLAANISKIKKVKFLIQGQEVETLSGHADLSDAFVPDLTRMSLSP